jgi:hypothetical protein
VEVETLHIDNIIKGRAVVDFKLYYGRESYDHMTKRKLALHFKLTSHNIYDLNSLSVHTNTENHFD